MQTRNQKHQDQNRNAKTKAQEYFENATVHNLLLFRNNFLYVSGALQVNFDVTLYSCNAQFWRTFAKAMLVSYPGANKLTNVAGFYGNTMHHDVNVPMVGIKTWFLAVCNSCCFRLR